MLARALSIAAVAAVSLVAVDALADKIATLHAKGPAPLAERTSIRNATEAAAKELGHVTIAEPEVLQGEGAAGDKAGTSEGLVAIGKATGADWVVEPTVMSSASGTHVDMKACQVATGRVETLARDLDPTGDVATQMREMLALLLRPQGVGDDPLPWQKKQPKPLPPEVLPKKPPPPPKDEGPKVAFGEGGHVALGAGGGAAFVVSRPPEARGSRLAWEWMLSSAFAIPKRPEIEIVARVAGLHGPGNALLGEVGARFLRPVGRFGFGAAATLGVFGLLSGARGARAVLGLSPVVAVALTRAIELDLHLGALRWAPSSDGTLLFAGGEGALLVRF